MKKGVIMANLFDNVAKDFSKYRTGYPKKFYETLESSYGVGLPNQKILDIATSNGLVARDLAAKNCIVTGIDNSCELINEAKSTENMGREIEYILGDVTELPFTNEYFDNVMAVHCWNVLPTLQTSREVIRVLKKDGKFVVAHFEHFPMKDDVVTQTKSLVAKHNKGKSTLSSQRLYPDWIDELYHVGFRNIETFTFDTINSMKHEEWRGRMRTEAEVGGSLSFEEVQKFDKELDCLLKKNYEGQRIKVHQRIFSIICVK
jgi:ubiquinone/menaquinone biosynthesis C-methylase UbiE